MGRGGAVGNRTPDLVIANDALYQLSYSPSPGDPDPGFMSDWVHPARGFAYTRG
jgi:hypothetical protein